MRRALLKKKRRNDPHAAIAREFTEIMNEETMERMRKDGQGRENEVGRRKQVSGRSSSGGRIGASRNGPRRAVCGPFREAGLGLF